MALDNTVEELIAQVRDITDEDNTTDISDELVLRMLNRSQQELIRLVTRRFNNQFMREVIYSNSDLGTDANLQARVLEIPDQAFGFAVNSVDTKIGDSWFPVSQVPFSYTLGLDNTVSTGYPLSYAVLGNKIYLFPIPDALTSIRVRYQFRAPKLVKSQGRITAFDVGANTITVDSLGSGLSTSVDDLSAFVNVVDHLTGEIKATLQVSGVTSGTKKLTIKTTGLDRSEVFGYAVADAIPANISLDDYVCLADGTCVPYLSHDLTNFLVDFAGFDVKRKLGILDQGDYASKERIEKAIGAMHFGRQNTKKIQRKYRTSNFSWQPWFRGDV